MKRDSRKGVFLRILQTFSKYLFYITPPNLRTTAYELMYKADKGNFDELLNSHISARVDHRNLSLLGTEISKVHK